MNNFLKTIVALIEGDDAKVLALKIQKKAKAAFTAQVAVKQAFTLSLEENVENAQESLQNALVNKGYQITDTDDYLITILSKRRHVEEAQKELDGHLETVAFLQEQLAEISKSK